LKIEHEVAAVDTGWNTVRAPDLRRGRAVSKLQLTWKVLLGSASMLATTMAVVAEDEATAKKGPRANNPWHTRRVEQAEEEDGVAMGSMRVARYG
jgi:hypothetical protein